MLNVHVKAKGVKVDLLPHLFLQESSGKLVLGKLIAQPPARKFTRNLMSEAFGYHREKDAKSYARRTRTFLSAQREFEDYLFDRLI